MPPQQGYGTSILDKSGPDSFAASLQNVASAFSQITNQVNTFGTTTDSVLQRVLNRFDSIRQAASTLFGAGGAGLGGGGGGGPAPSPGSRGITLGSQWRGRSAPNPQTGSAANVAGMPNYGQQAPPFPVMQQPTPPTPVTSWTPMAGPTPFAAPGGGAPGGPGGGAPPAGPGGPGAGNWWGGRPSPAGGGPGAPGGAPPGAPPTPAPSGAPPAGPPGGQPSFSGQNASQSGPAAIAGWLQKGPLTSAMQGAAYGQLGQAMGYGSRSSLMQVPNQVFGAQNYQDFIQAQSIAMQQLGLQPGTQNWSAAQGGANVISGLTGVNRVQAMQTFQQMQQPGTVNFLQARGINIRPGGQMQGTQQDYDQLITRIWPGGLPSADLVAQSFLPGAPAAVWASQVFGDPSSPGYQAFENYVRVKAQRASKGQGMPDISTPGGLKKAGLWGPYQQQQQAQGAAAQAQGRLMPSLADAAGKLDDVATKFLKLFDDITGFLGIGAGTGAAGFATNALKLGLGNVPILGSLLGGGGGGGIAGLFGGGLGGGGGGGGGLLGGIFGGTGGGGTAGGILGGILGNIPVLGGLSKSIYGQFAGGSGGGGGGAATSAAAGGGATTTADISGGGGKGATLASMVTPAPGTQVAGAAGAPTPTAATTNQAVLTAAITSGVQTASTTGGSAWGYSNVGGMGPMDTFGLFDASASGSSSSGGSGSTGSTTDGGSSSGGTTTGGPNLTQAYQYFIGKGLKDYMSAGIVGNLVQESNVSPTAGNANANWGIAQWTPPTSLYDWAKANKRDPNTLSSQLDYLWSEINGGSEAGALAALKGSSDAASAADAFMNKFERPDPKQANQAGREKYAQNILKSKGASYARGSQYIGRTQLALLHQGERVISAADNWSNAGRYQRLDNTGNVSGSSSAQVVHLNFKPGSVVLQVPANATQTDMQNIASQFSQAIAQPQVLATIRST